MIVYVVCHGYDYEGEEVDSVFENKKDAVKIARAFGYIEKTWDEYVHPEWGKRILIHELEML